MANFTAVLDTCVLYPAPTRDLLLECTLRDFFHAKWSQDILRELRQTLRSKRPDIPDDKVDYLIARMTSNTRDTEVTGYQDHIPVVHLPDEGDRHVVAAAIAADADLIVTSNLRDFPEQELQKWKIEAQHPDEFLHHQFHLAPDKFLDCAKTIRGRLKKPPISVEQYLDKLRQQGLLATAGELERYSQLI